MLNFNSKFGIYICQKNQTLKSVICKHLSQYRFFFLHTSKHYVFVTSTLTLILQSWAPSHASLGPWFVVCLHHSLPYLRYLTVHLLIPVPLSVPQDWFWWASKRSKKENDIVSAQLIPNLQRKRSALSNFLWSHYKTLCSCIWKAVYFLSA